MTGALKHLSRDDKSIEPIECFKNKHRNRMRQVKQLGRTMYFTGTGVDRVWPSDHKVITLVINPRVASGNAHCFGKTAQTKDICTLCDYVTRLAQCNSPLDTGRILGQFLTQQPVALQVKNPCDALWLADWSEEAHNLSQKSFSL